jgi:ribosomal protein S18 acetylase RimI-like enzyme
MVKLTQNPTPAKLEPDWNEMIRIEPLFVTDYAQTRALLRHEPDFVPAEHICNAGSLLFRGLTFWQHWLPCKWHFASSVYVAKEDGIILGLIALRPLSKAKESWQIDHLIVHPQHRGRGIAQELLRYAFAMLGSQGVDHFVAEVSDHNSAALCLFGNCGFCRSAKVTHFEIEKLSREHQEKLQSSLIYRLATPADKHALLQLNQEVLPPEIRPIFGYTADDFAVSDSMESWQRLRHRITHSRVWYWVLEDPERKVFTSAVKVIAHEEGDFHLEFAVHPGWQDQADDLVAFALKSLPLRSHQTTSVSAKAFDFDTVMIEALLRAGMERSGGFTLLTREHWKRAREPRKLRAVSLPGIANPAVNMPLATD